ncbi:MAG: glycosyltransferase family 2 protein [Parcubacteria group bacterium]
MNKIGIVIINFTGYAERFLIECRDGLRKLTFPKEQIKVYVVDNASTEESRKYLKDNFPEATIIPRVDGNYSAANNAGLMQAMADNCDLFVCLNLDTVVAPDWLTELVRAVNSDASVGIAQSLIMLYPKEKNEINSVGNAIHYLGFGFTEEYRVLNSKSETLKTKQTQNPNFKVQNAKIKEISGYASGCSLVIKKEVIEEIGFYDEEYYMYHDDLELCWRAKLAGYKIVLAQKSIVCHKYEFSRSARMLYYLERNRYLNMFNFYKPATIILLLPAIVAADIAMIAFAIANGWFKTKMKTEAYFLKLKTWKYILKTRKKIKKNRRLRDREIMRCFYGKVLFQEIDNPILRYLGNPLMAAYWALVKKLIFW